MADNGGRNQKIENKGHGATNIIFTIGSYEVMVRDVVWLLVVTACAGIVVLGMLVRNSKNGLSAISASSTLLSIALSFIAIIKSMLDSAESARVSGKTEENLKKLDAQMNLLFSESAIHTKSESELKEKLESVCEILSSLAEVKGADGKDKEQLIEKLANSATIEEVNTLNDFFTDYFN